MQKTLSDKGCQWIKQNYGGKFEFTKEKHHESSLPFHEGELLEHALRAENMQSQKWIRIRKK